MSFDIASSFELIRWTFFFFFFCLRLSATFNLIHEGDGQEWEHGWIINFLAQLIIMSPSCPLIIKFWVGLHKCLLHHGNNKHFLWSSVLTLLSFDSLSNGNRKNLLSCRLWLWNNNVFGHPIIPFQVLKNYISIKWGLKIWLNCYSVFFLFCFFVTVIFISVKVE